MDHVHNFSTGSLLFRYVHGHAAAVRESRGTLTFGVLTARTCVAAARARNCPVTPPTASNT